MALINSISGIRGTIGGKAGENITPVDIVEFVSAYAKFLGQSNDPKKVIIGRDARVSGQAIADITAGALRMSGIKVIDIGLAATPTVQMAVIHEQAAGGIIITASHNPENWNALKLLDDKGEFLSGSGGKQLENYIKGQEYNFVREGRFGGYKKITDWTKKHIKMICDLDVVDLAAINRAGFSVLVDGINSVGGVAVPMLLEALGVSEIYKINCDPTGRFAHPAEPLAKNLASTCKRAMETKADIGLVVDPDVDRLAVIDEKGRMFSEEYTLVAASDYILSQKPGNTVSNLSSSLALKEITEKRYGGRHYYAPVGEVNVVNEMKRVKAVIGGEGNGGVIYPPLHYGRDALVGIALILSHLAQSGKTYSELLSGYPQYHIYKTKIELNDQSELSTALSRVKAKFGDCRLNEADGIRIDRDNEWVHIRGSNTEPIIRIIAEAPAPEQAKQLANKINQIIA
jgi:phosphomannomutase